MIAETRRSANLAYTAVAMNRRKTISGPIAILVAFMTVALLASCGSNDSAAVSGTVETEDDPVLMLQPDGVFTLDDVVAVGWKKSKELSSETLPDATSVWYGFYNQRDVEIWIYPSHDIAVKSGTGPADVAVGKGKPAPFAVGGISATKKSYGAYAIVGNLVLMCEVKIDDCEGLLNAIK